MPKYVVEREFPGAGKLTPEELKGAFEHGMRVASEMDSGLEWVQSYITDDKVFCEYIAPNEELLREHARKAGFTANSISKVATIVTHTTLES
jgi:hypothetical protein